MLSFSTPSETRWIGTAQRPTKMSLSIIGAGLGRTGTLSLKRALELLGLGPCYHSLDSSRAEVERVFLALNQDPPDWNEAFGPYRATVDFPAFNIYRELVQANPEAKVILTIREPASYFRSVQRLVSELSNHQIGPQEMEFGRSISCQDTPAHQIFRNPQDRDVVLDGFRRHNLEVQRLIPADRLLVLDLTQGWDPLCAFLGCPIPSAPLPCVNSSDELSSLLLRLRHT